MRAKTYEKRIIDSMKSVGTYRAEFSETIKMLAKMYEYLDAAIEGFEKDGGEFIVEHTNKAGKTNIIKNPYYQIIENMENNILVYARELGLTPAGIKKINADEIAGKKTMSKLDNVLSMVVGGG